MVKSDVEELKSWGSKMGLVVLDNWNDDVGEFNVLPEDVQLEIGKMGAMG